MMIKLIDQGFSKIEICSVLKGLGDSCFDAIKEVKDPGQKAWLVHTSQPSLFSIIKCNKVIRFCIAGHISNPGYSGTGTPEYCQQVQMSLELPYAHNTATVAATGLVYVVISQVKTFSM